MVKTAEEYSRVTAEVSPNLNVLYITEDNIVVCGDMLHSLVSDGSKTLPGTQRMCQMEVVAYSQIKHSQFNWATREIFHNFK